MSKRHLRTGLRVLMAAILSVSISTVVMAADNVVMNVGWATPIDSDYGVFAKKFKELTDKYSNGSVQVKLRCCAQIGTEDNAFKAMQLGTVDGYFITQNNVSPHWPLMDVFVLPYIFQNKEHLAKVTNGPVGDEIRAMILKDTGVHLLSFGGASYRDMFNSKRPINSIADMKGLKMRVPKNKVMIETFRAFGAEPVPLAWSDTPTAIQTRTIDGGDNGTAVIKDMKFYEFAKHLVVLDHFVGVSPLFASDRFIKKLNADQLAAVIKAAKEAGEFDAANKNANIEKIRTWLVEKGGMKLSTPDRKDFIAAAQTVQSAFAAKNGAKFKELLSKIEEAAN